VTSKWSLPNKQSKANPTVWQQFGCFLEDVFDEIPLQTACCFTDFSSDQIILLCILWKSQLLTVNGPDFYHNRHKGSLWLIDHRHLTENWDLKLHVDSIPRQTAKIPHNTRRVSGHNQMAMMARPSKRFCSHINIAEFLLWQIIFSTIIGLAQWL